MLKLNLSPKRPPRIRPWLIYVNAFVCILFVGYGLGYDLSGDWIRAYHALPFAFGIAVIGWVAGHYSGLRAGVKLMREHGQILAQLELVEEKLDAMSEDGTSGCLDPLDPDHPDSPFRN